MKEHISDLVIKCIRQTGITMTDADMHTKMRNSLKKESLEHCYYEADGRDDTQVCIYGVIIKADDTLPDDVIVARDKDGHEIMRVNVVETEYCGLCNKEIQPNDECVCSENGLR